MATGVRFAGVPPPPSPSPSPSASAAPPDDGQQYAEPVAIARMQRAIASWSRVPRWLRYLLSRALTASCRLELTTSIALSLQRLRAYTWTRQDKFKYTFMAALAVFSLFIMKVPGFPLKLVFPLLYALAILVPVTSQFFLPAAPILCWLLFYYSSQFIPPAERPHIWVSLLPTLETVWYGASISEILTNFGHPILDILAWIPYGLVHFAGPFVVAALLFIFGPPASVKFFAAAFGFLNIFGVVIQILVPCAPPWYELREGLTPANYGMKGSPAGLARIDRLFGGHGYTLTFTNAPVPFGAFPSLHSGSATMEALMLSYFFPVGVTLYKSAKRAVRLDMRIVYWAYAGWLYWCTMYLMHHYLIDLVAGGCLATICFYCFLSDEMREAMELHYAYRSSSPAPLSAAPGVLRPTSAFGVRRDGRVVLPDAEDLAVPPQHAHPSQAYSHARYLANMDPEAGPPYKASTLFALDDVDADAESDRSDGRTFAMAPLLSHGQSQSQGVDRGTHPTEGPIAASETAPAASLSAAPSPRTPSPKQRVHPLDQDSPQQRGDEMPRGR